MKINIQIILWIISILFIISCGDKNEMDADSSEIPDSPIKGIVRREHFINRYYDINDVTIGRRGVNHESDYFVISILVNGSKYTSNDDQYNQIAKQIGDTCWNGYNDPSYAAVNDEIKAIDVICVDAYDDKHGEGSSLSDIATVVLASPYNFIKSGYKDERKQEEIESIKDYYRPYYISFIDHYDITSVNMNDLGSTNVKYFDPEIFIIFNKLPAEKGIYRFYVTVKFSDKKFKKMVTINLY